MKALKPLTLVFLVAITLSACNLNNKVGTDMDKPTDMAEQEAIVQMSPTPTLASDNSLDSIEADLKSTTILEEDFSDLD